MEKSPSPVYGARLELVYGLIAHRGFESLLLRQPMKSNKMISQKARIYALFCCPETEIFYMKTEDDFWYKMPLDRIRTLFWSVFRRIEDFFEGKQLKFTSKSFTNFSVRIWCFSRNVRTPDSGFFIFTYQRMEVKECREILMGLKIENSASRSR